LLEEKEMPSPNPIIAKQLHDSQTELAQLKAEKQRLFPPNLHPFAQADSFTQKASPEQIRRRNELVARIEAVEQQIEELTTRLYTQ
jgi:hypothetical protein